MDSENCPGGPRFSSKDEAREDIATSENRPYFSPKDEARGDTAATTGKTPAVIEWQSQYRSVLNWWIHPELSLKTILVIAQKFYTFFGREYISTYKRTYMAMNLSHKLSFYLQVTLFETSYNASITSVQKIFLYHQAKNSKTHTVASSFFPLEHQNILTVKNWEKKIFWARKVSVSANVGRWSWRPSLLLDFIP